MAEAGGWRTFDLRTPGRQGPACPGREELVWERTCKAPVGWCEGSGPVKPGEQRKELGGEAGSPTHLGQPPRAAGTGMGVVMIPQECLGGDISAPVALSLHDILPQRPLSDPNFSLLKMTPLALENHLGPLPRLLPHSPSL